MFSRATRNHLISFYDHLPRPLVVKPLQGTGSNNQFVCSTKTTVSASMMVCDIHDTEIELHVVNDDKIRQARKDKYAE